VASGISSSPKCKALVLVSPVKSLEDVARTFSSPQAGSRDNGQRSTLATGREVELPVFLGEFRIGRRRVRTWFIAGEHLIGMEFLGVAFSLFQIDFRRGTWALEQS